MTTASQDKITVPGDDRLTKLNVSTKTPFWTKIPIIKELRVAVGWQKGMLITGLAITAFFLLVALFAPLIAPYGHAQIKAADGTSFPAQAAPSAEHIWGTTAAGFDVFSRVVWGARTAVIAIVVAVLLSIFAGVLLGLVSGYYGGWVDRILVMIADAVYSFPSLLLAILMAIMISHGQSGLWSGILASGISITVVYIPQYFRTIRAEVIRIKESAYVESARVVGASTWRIMTKHLFKNSTRTLPVILTLNSSEAILTLAGLGFLGFGIEPTAAAEWGYDLNRSVSDVTAGIWWTAVFPGIAIVLIVLGITLVGESLNDLADPRLRAHGMKDKKELRAKAINILKKVGIPDAETRVDYYPHQFSGGQKQRIVIAMALVLNPGLILADEPTTALDVTVQAEILDLLRLARDEFDASVLIITHNMGVIADIADQVVVMYRGHVVEQGDVEQIFYHPKDDYTKRLLGAVPRIGQKLVVRDREGKPIERKADWREQPIAVEAKNLTITYPGHLMQPDFKAVDGANFTIHRSEVLGLVGESGSGKSTTGRAIAGLQKVSGGSLNVLGIEMNGVKERDFKPKRADIGFVFQDPGSSFNPLMTIAENVAEPLLVHHKYGSVADAKNYVGDLLEMVQLPRAYMNRFPHELSGGQRQRASLARGLALKPSLLIADEPTSALDVSVQAKVLELFKRLQAEIGFACLFITHDLAVVDMLADRIMVMHKGQIVEHGDADQIMQHPENPYTKKLLASLPVPDPREQQQHRAHLHELLAQEA